MISSADKENFIEIVRDDSYEKKNDFNTCVTGLDCDDTFRLRQQRKHRFRIRRGH